MTDEKDSAIESYKNYLNQSADHPAVKKHKGELIRAYRPSLGENLVAFGIPVACLLLAFLFFFQIQNARVLKKPAQPVLISMQPASMLLKPSKEMVKVKRVTSRVGSTMVYQKRQGDIPLTVVWVFVRPSQLH